MTPEEKVREIAQQFAGVEGCWPWPLSCDKDGYGQLRGAGRMMLKAHRVSYTAFKGPIPVGLSVRHKCDNPPCFNPACLVPGTQLDNMRDMVERGRAKQPASAGELNGRAKITAATVLEMRASTESRRALAERYGLSKSAVRNVLSGRSWGHVQSSRAAISAGVTR